MIHVDLNISFVRPETIPQSSDNNSGFDLNVSSAEITYITSLVKNNANCIEAKDELSACVGGM
jgi:hypothetical protein